MSPRERRFPLILLLLPALLLAAGCRATDDEPGNVTAVDTLTGGVPVVHNRPPGDRFEAGAWQIREDLRLGSVSGEGPEAFGDVRGIAVDGRGRIYVLDAQAREIRAFGSDGTHIWSAGREGEGPGEFREPNGLTLGPEGRLWVADHGASRYAIWSTGGEALETRRTTFPVYGYLWPGSFDGEGRLVDRSMRIGADGAPYEQYFLRRYRGADGAVDTLPFPSPPEGWTPGYFSFERGSKPVPYAGRFLWRMDRRGHVWFGVSDRYRITKRALEGDTLRVLTGQIEPIPVSDEEREAAEEEVLAFARRVGHGEADLSRIPETKAPIHGLTFDDRGRLWVRLVPGEDGTSRFDLYGRDGRWQNSAVADFSFSEYRRALVRGDYLYAVVRDSLDVAHVVRGRIAGPR